MLKRKHLIAIIAIAVIAAIVLTTTFANFGGFFQNFGVVPMSAAEKEEEFELKMNVSPFDLDAEVVDKYIDNLSLHYGTDDNGDYMVPFSYNSMPTTTAERCRSAKEAGLSKYAISDAVSYAYTKLSSAEAKKAANASLGSTIKVSKLQGLSNEFKKEILENPVLLYGFIKITKDLKYGQNKTIGSRCKWMGKFISKYDKAVNSGKGLDGTWLKAIDKQPYVNRNYLRYATAYLIILDSMEINVERLQSRVNYHLLPGQTASKTKVTKANYQEDKAAITFTYYYKDGSAGPKIGSNLSDKRPELFKSTVAKKRTKVTPSGQPTPDVQRTPSSSSTPSSGGGSGSTSTGKKPSSSKDGSTSSNPSSSSNGSGKTNSDSNNYSNPSSSSHPGKDESQSPDTTHVNDDSGPGNYEETPTVDYPTSDSVDESQYQPQADEQGGGTQNPSSNIDNGYTSESGNTVSDGHGDGTYTEYEQSSTDDYSGTADHSQDSQAGNNNGEMDPPK